MKSACVKALLIGASVMAMGLPTMTVQADGGSSGKSSQVQGKKAPKKQKKTIRLIARMGDDDVGAAAKAVYEEKTVNGALKSRKFTAEVENATPGDTYEVRVNGELVGTITIDSLGNGKLELRPKPDDAGELPIPADFPALKAGDSVTIGEFSGTFAAR